MWISGSVHLAVKDGRRHIEIASLSVMQSPGLPKGPEVNAPLADPDSTLRREVMRVWNEGGEIEIGRMRVMNGGGAYTLPANMLDLTCEDGTHDALWSKISQKLGGEPETATPVVFRGWGAPGTYGVFDGGGAGRGESIPSTAHWFLVTKCLGENLGEIGMLAHLPDGSEGRIDYRLGILGFYDYQDAIEPWLTMHIVEEWLEAHGSVPLVHSTAGVELAPLPDTMWINGAGKVENIKLAMEWHSASVECLTMSVLTFLDSANQIRRNVDFRLRFIDLESRGGKGLNRRIGIVLRRGDQLAVVAYKGGVFDHDFPMIPVCAETLQMDGNEKFETVIEMIRG